MKKRSSILLGILLALIVIMPLAANAATPSLDPLQQLTEVFEGRVEGGEVTGGTGLPGFQRPHELSSTEAGADTITTIVFNILDFMKYLLGGIAIIFIMIGGIKLIAGGHDIDEISEKEKRTLQYILYGLLLVIVADSLVQNAFYGDKGECLSSALTAEECGKAGSKEIKGIYNFVEIFLASIAVLIIILSGMRMIISAGTEDVIDKNKKRIAMALVGLLVVGISEFLVKDFIFVDGGAEIFKLEAGRSLIASITNFVSSFVATIAIIFFIYGGYTYVTSIGNQDGVENAKKILIGAAIGLIVAGGAYGIVRTVSTVEMPLDVPAVESLP